MLVFVAVVVCCSIFFSFTSIQTVLVQQQANAEGVLTESTKLLNQKIDTVQQLQGDLEQKVKAIEAANDFIKVKVEQHDVSDTNMEQQVKAISDTVKEVEQSVQVIEQARDKAEELAADANVRAKAAEEEIARIKAETNAAEMKSEEAAADANVRANAAEEEIARIKAETNAAEMKSSEATDEEKQLIVKAETDAAANAKEKEVIHVTEEKQVIFISPNSGGTYNDMGGVSSMCNSWDEEKAKGKQIAGILFNHSNWMCGSGSVGNKLGLYFQARALASHHQVSFQIAPACLKENDNIISWLPQTVIPQNATGGGIVNEAPPPDSFVKRRELMCNCAGTIAHQCSDGWPQLAVTWHQEIRTALDNWALSAGKPKVEKGAATIHLRCGDIIDPKKIASGASADMGFLKSSFYLKHLRGIDIKSIHILTTPLDACKEGSSERHDDCMWAPQCSRIVDALINKLSSSLALSREHFQVHDHESSMWSMHHIAFSEISFCSPSTFCLFPSLGSNHVIHTGSSGKFPSAKKTLPDLLKTFVYDEGDYVVKMKSLPKNGTVEKVIEFIQE